MNAKDMKNARGDIKTTKAAKAILEREIITQSQMITLTHREAERFVTALENPPKANTRLRQLLKKQGTRHQDRTRSV